MDENCIGVLKILDYDFFRTVQGNATTVYSCGAQFYYHLVLLRCFAGNFIFNQQIFYRVIPKTRRLTFIGRLQTCIWICTVYLLSICYCYWQLTCRA